MAELPQGLYDGDWPIVTEIELLKRVQVMHSQLDEKIRNMTQELKTNRLYPRKTDSKELRIRLYHTFTPPVQPESEETPATPGRWTLRIEAAETKPGASSVVNFSTYFRKATIELDPRIYADSIIEWTSFQKAHHDVDGLEISRSGHVPHTVRIKLLPAQMPERFSISELLENAIGEFLSPAQAFTKQNIVMATWEYIKRKNLIKEDDCRVVVCDASLAQVFDCELLPFSSVVVALKPHLTPVNSIDLEYTLSLSGSASESDVLDEKFIDVDVGAVDPLEKVRERVLVEWEELLQEQQKDLDLLKQQETDIVERLHDHCRKRDWMMQFAHDPVRFMKDVAQSQQADQQILVVEAETDEINVPHPQQFSQPWANAPPMQPASSTRLRCDPTDYAKKQQEKKDRARDLREQRSKGVFSDDHTFAPKTNPKSRTPESTSREEQEAQRTPPSSSNSFDDMPIRPTKRVLPSSNNNNTRSNNNNHDDEEAVSSGDAGSDALDNLSRKFPKNPPPKHVAASFSPPTPLEPEHDTLFREVKRATGKELDDIPIRRVSTQPATRHTGPCLRNSSCGCPQCAGGASMAAPSRPDPPVRRRESKSSVAAVTDDPYACQSNTSRSYTGAQHEMELLTCAFVLTEQSSLALLKSKMSRRKSRSAPTNQASLFVEKSTLAVQSARNPPHASRSQQPVPSAASASRRAAPIPAPAAVAPAALKSNRNPPPPVARGRQKPSQEESQDDHPPPIPSGYTMPEDLDEFADQSEEMEECDNCHRRFNLTSFSKHRKICEKVFSAQRKVFNMAAKRLEGTEAEKIAKKSSSSGKSGGGGKKMSAEEQPLNKKADWKQKSSAFRDAMKASRDVTIALKEGRELPPMKPSAPDPSLIQCEYCSRRFNDKAAERHITFCREKTQRDSMAKGPPKKAPAPVATKPTRAPAKKK